MSTHPELSFKIHGMDCVEEVMLLRREVGPVVGGDENLAFDILNSKMTVSGTADVSSDTIIGVVARAGLRAEVWREEASDSRMEGGLLSWNRTFLTMASGLLALAGFLIHVRISGGFQAALGAEGMGLAREVPWAARALYALSILAGAWHVLPKAWRAAQRFRPDMNLLMVIAVVGAVGLGEWLEAATVAFLFALSLALESWSVGRARRAVEALLDLTPPTVRLIPSRQSEQYVAPEQAPVGSLFLVKPGERIALDGVIVRGASHVNQAPITGESQPIPKGPEDPVFAGTINGDGALEIRSTKPAGETTLAHIIRMVGEAQSRRAPSEQWVEKFARIYTPVVLGLALVFLLIPPVLFGGDWREWLYRSLVLLVIACPCALVISTPVSIVAALAAAARNGVLVKGGAFIEAPARLQAVAFDKTGTLTRGEPTVAEVVPLSGHDERELLERAAAMEMRSDHPLARAIVAFAEERGLRPPPADDFQIIQGKGATARWNGESYWLGSHRYLEERGQETEEVHQRLETMSGAGRTVTVLGNETHVCGLIALADAVRPESKPTVQALRDAGIRHIVMLTGDNQPTAQAIGRETGVDEVHAELLPADKVAVVDALIARYGTVAMVGDGVNDAPAMGRATFGIAMGAFGSDAAIETADIALMADDLTKIPWLIQHARRTLAVIRQNVTFSLSVKAIFVILTFAGYASLWAAIAADMGASLLVISNGLRLLRT